MTGDFPRFRDAIERCGPQQSSPHPMTLRELQRLVKNDVRRSELLSRLQALCRRVAGEMRVACALIGGSFVQPHRALPKDLDCALYYAMRHPTRTGVDSLRVAWQIAADSDIDARFIPLDADPLVLIRMTAFMTSLYHAHRPGACPPTPEPGLLLVSFDDLDS
jgi:hypothetical protein